MSSAVPTMMSKLKAMLDVIRMRAHDTSTVEGRSRERYRRAAMTSLSSVAVRAVTLGTTLISVPLCVRYLGQERYALWMIITSTILMLTFADLGIGNGLMNAVSESHGKEDEQSAARYISSAAFMLLGIALVIETVLIAVYRFVPWERVFNVHSEIAVREAGTTAFLCITIFALNLPFGVVQRVQMAYQQGYVNYIWSAVGSVLGLAGVILGIQLHLGLPFLVLAFAGAPLVSTLLNGLVLFGWKRRELRPRWSLVEWSAAKKITSTGILFFVLQVSMMLGYNSDNMVIAQVLGAAAVTQYAVAAKLFTIIPNFISTMLTPLWPAYGEARARGDVAWIKKALKRSFVLGLSIAVPANIALVVLGRMVMRVWVGPQIPAPFLLLFALGIGAILNGAIFSPLATFLNGTNNVRFQAICAITMGVTNLPLSIALTKYIGVSGVVFGTAITQVLFILIPMSVYLPRVLKSLNAHTTELKPEAVLT